MKTDKVYLAFSTSKIDNNKNSAPQSAVYREVPACANHSETPLNSFNKYLVNFQGHGLSRTLGKKAYHTAEAIKEELISHPKSKGIVGNLPAEWIEKIPKQGREAKIKELYADLKKIIKDFRLHGNKQKTSEKLSIAFQKAGVIKDNEKISMKYLNYGLFGEGYQLQGVSDGQYMLKYFKLNDYLGSISHAHGNYTESNRGAYWQKNAGTKTQRVRYYFGDVDAGYMVNKFIGYKTPEYKGRVVPEKIYGLINEEFDGTNTIKGHEYDYGGLAINSHILSQNKTARYVYKKLYYKPENQRLHEFTKFLGMKKYRNNKDIKWGLVSSIGLLPKKDRSKCVGELLQNSDNQLKKVIARLLYHLPAEEKHWLFIRLFKGADEELKKILADNV